MKKWFSVILISVIIIVALAVMPPLPSHVGKVDFRAYWSASYLLVRSENFSDPTRLFQVEQTVTDYQADSPLMTWNPPWLLVLLIPFTFVPFSQASWWYFPVLHMFRAWVAQERAHRRDIAIELDRAAHRLVLPIDAYCSANRTGEHDCVCWISGVRVFRGHVASRRWCGPRLDMCEATVGVRDCPACTS